MTDKRMEILKEIRNAHKLEEVRNLSLKYLYEARDKYKVYVAEDRLRRFMANECNVIEKEIKRLSKNNFDQATIDTYKNTVLGIKHVIYETVNKRVVYLSYRENWFQRDVEVLLSKLYEMKDVIFSNKKLDEIDTKLDYFIDIANDLSDDFNSKTLEVIELFIELFNDLSYKNDNSGRSLIHEMCRKIQGYVSDIDDYYKECNDDYDDDYYPEYNIKPDDPDYEFSVSEALDNMYGK